MHSSVSVWSTTSPKPTRKPFATHCLSSELPFQPTKCNVCWCFVARQLPLDTPSREVVAGCAIATYLVKLYCLLVLDNVVRLRPRVSLDVFIDDSHQSAQGTPREARKLIVAAGRTFTEEAQKHLRVRFADQKTAIVSSRQELALSVARQMGLQKEAVQTQTVGLGVNVSAGKTRTDTSARRKKMLTRRAGSLAQRIYKCGVWG